MSAQAVAVEMLPSSDRCSIVVLLRASEPIPMSTATDTLKRFAQALEDKVSEARKRAGLVIPEKKLVTLE